MADALEAGARLAPVAEAEEEAREIIAAWHAHCVGTSRGTQHTFEWLETAIAAALARRDATAREYWDTLFDAIKHGNQDHHDWLKKAIEDHRAGRTVERPRGLNTADAIAKARTEKPDGE